MTTSLVVRRFFLIFSVSVFPLLSWADLDFLCSHGKEQFNCVEFVNNYDGDTITVNIPRVHAFFSKNIPVRIFGIDSPERKTEDPCEKEKAEIAKEFTNDILSRGHSIELRSVQRDKYFRLLADVFVDGRSLGQQLLKRGLAVEYDGGEKPKVNWCK
jgi:micrococcal nuclease